MTGASRTIALAAGGTGGHVFPALGLSSTLSRNGMDIVLISDARGTRFLDDRAKLDVFEIPAADFTRAPLRGAISLVRAFFACRKLMRERQVQAAVGFGGYPSLAGMLAAVSMRIPTCIHEQNAVMGRANRLLAKLVRQVALAFDETLRISPRRRAKAVVTGNPVRPAIAALGERPFVLAEDDEKLSLLVLGGSQGASVFSRVVPEAIADLAPALRARLRVVQQCRMGEEESVREVYRTCNVESEVSTFFSDMPAKLRGAHLVVSRAGASTTSEIAVAGLPSILVPFPQAANDHQTANAQFLADVGGAWVIPQSEFTAAALTGLLTDMFFNPGELTRAAAAALRVGKPDAANRLADLVLDLVRGPRKASVVGAA